MASNKKTKPDGPEETEYVKETPRPDASTSATGPNPYYRDSERSNEVDVTQIPRDRGKSGTPSKVSPLGAQDGEPIPSSSESYSKNLSKIKQNG
jgi:hypothetical protein